MFENIQELGEENRTLRQVLETLTVDAGTICESSMQTEAPPTKEDCGTIT